VVSDEMFEVITSQMAENRQDKPPGKHFTSQNKEEKRKSKKRKKSLITQQIK
jgi:hypothetical protein